MKLKPVEKKSRPVYPTLREFMAGENAAPRSHWSRDLAGAAVFVLALSVGGCDTPLVSSHAGGAPRAAAQTGEKQAQGGTVAAPIFNHGVGEGATGCVVMTPPMFLSEEEAVKVIKDELAKHGVTLKKGEELEDVVVQIPVYDPSDTSEEENRPKLLEPRSLAVDAIDKRDEIAVVFISESDCEKFESYGGMFGSVGVYHFKELASSLAESAGKSGNKKRYMGFFYDPTPVPDEEDSDFAALWEEEKEGTKGNTREALKRALDRQAQREKEKSKGLLRQQVRDFADWLEEQGVEVQHVEESESPEKSN